MKHHEFQSDVQLRDSTMSDRLASSNSQTWGGAAAVLMSLLSQNLGASFAKHLFPLTGAAGMTCVRIALAAGILLVLRRGWRAGFGWGQLMKVLPYGITLGLMNLLIYQAFARIPIGIAVAIEVLGPLAVVVSGARRARDFIWVGAAATGLTLLLPLRDVGSNLDLTGIAFAVGAAGTWALYIVFGKRLASAPDIDAVSWGMVVATAITLPFGVLDAGRNLLSAHVLMWGIAIAALSSALPYTLEMAALRRLPAHVFGILVSSAPAVAALAGFVVLDERLETLQWTAIGLIMVAVGGSTFTPGRRT
jgi:inner membrane transporter RhtA